MQKKDNKKVNTSKSGKSPFSGFTFKDSFSKEYSKNLSEVNRIRYENVTDDILDGAIVSEGLILPESIKSIQIMLNRKNVNKIVKDHGDFNSEDIIITCNEFEQGVFIKGNDETPDKLNLIKNTPDGYFIIGANRFNGYGIVTFFERYNNSNKTKNYLNSILERGISFNNSKRAADPPSIASENNLESRVPASLSGVRADNKSVL